MSLSVCVPIHQDPPEYVGLLEHSTPECVCLLVKTPECVCLLVKTPECVCLLVKTPECVCLLEPSSFSGNKLATRFVKLCSGATPNLYLSSGEARSYRKQEVTLKKTLSLPFPQVRHGPYRKRLPIATQRFTSHQFTTFPSPDTSHGGQPCNTTLDGVVTLSSGWNSNPDDVTLAL